MNEQMHVGLSHLNVDISGATALDDEVQGHSCPLPQASLKTLGSSSALPLHKQLP